MDYWLLRSSWEAPWFACPSPPASAFQEEAQAFHIQRQGPTEYWGWGAEKAPDQHRRQVGPAGAQEAAARDQGDAEEDPAGRADRVPVAVRGRRAGAEQDPQEAGAGRGAQDGPQGAEQQEQEEQAQDQDLLRQQGRQDHQDGGKLNNMFEKKILHKDSSKDANWLLARKKKQEENNFSLCYMMGQGYINSERKRKTWESVALLPWGHPNLNLTYLPTKPNLFDLAQIFFLLLPATFLLWLFLPHSGREEEDATYYQPPILSKNEIDLEFSPSPENMFHARVLSSLHCYSIMRLSYLHNKEDLMW